MALTTFIAWPLPLIHGRKPYTLSALCLALSLQLPQGLVTSTLRSPETLNFRVGLLLPRAISRLAAGLVNINLVPKPLDLFGASLMSVAPHQEMVFGSDRRCHGGGMGIWLGIWTWCYIASISIEFLIGAAIIGGLQPSWGFYIALVLITTVMIVNILGPETRRPFYDEAIVEQVAFTQDMAHGQSRGEVSLHVSGKLPQWWLEEIFAGIQLEVKMLSQTGFSIMALYIAWIYAQIILVIVLLSALLSREYRWHPMRVGLGVIGIAMGSLLAVPLSKASLFARARKKGPRTDSMTIATRVTWSSHLVRRILLTSTLPFLALTYTLSSAGRKVQWIIPALFSGFIGFFSNLATAKCYGIVMETFDTCDLQPGSNSGHRLQSLTPSLLQHHTTYSSFPRVTAGIFMAQTLGFHLAAAATVTGAVLTRQIGVQASTGVTAAILFFLTLLLTAGLWRFKEVHVIPDSVYSTWRKSIAAMRGEMEPEDWRPIIVGNPSGKMRRMNLLELGKWSRWSKIRTLNRLTKK